MRSTGFVLIAVALAVAPSLAHAQQPTRRPVRRQTTIEIRGQVPTPQVVTVRPREVPTYSRRILTPNFYDRNFWPSILPGYQLVPRRAITGRPPVDTTMRSDSTGAMTGAPSFLGGAATPRADSTGAAGTPRPPVTPPVTSDSSAARPGTPPARTR
jgi:hypothetical protein